MSHSDMRSRDCSIPLSPCLFFLLDVLAKFLIALKRHISRQTLLVLCHVLVERNFGVSVLPERCCDREIEQKRLLCRAQ